MSLYFIVRIFTYITLIKIKNVFCLKSQYNNIIFKQLQINNN